MRIVLGLAMLACAGAAGAQGAPQDRWLVGGWAGTVTTPFDDMPRHQVRIDILIERSGEPTAELRYANLHCTAMWTDGERTRTGWRLRELDQEDPGNNCPEEMIVHIRRAPNGLAIRWTEPGSGRLLADAVLRQVRR